MAFSTIFIIVGIGYVLVYAGMICYDLFIKKDPAELLPKVEDEDVDISDEVGQFQPILIDKDAKPDNGKEKPRIAEKTDGIKDEGNNENGTSGTDSNSTGKPPTGSTEFSDDQPNNRKSLSDRGPAEPTTEYKKRISELVKQKRKEMIAEETDGGTAHGNSVKTNSSASIIGSTAQTEVNRNENGETTKRQSVTVPKHNQRKPPKPKTTKPEKEIVEPPKFMYLEVDIDEGAQQTKLCGGKPAEEVQEDFKKVPLSEIKRLTEELGSYIELKTGVPQPTEEEIEAINEAAKRGGREPPVFRCAG